MPALLFSVVGVQVRRSIRLGLGALMVIVGLWLGIIGYGVLYAGVNKLGGGKCTFGQAFRGGCGPTAASATAATTSGGTTLLGAQQAIQAQQSAAVPTVPIPAVGFTP